MRLLNPLASKCLAILTFISKGILSPAPLNIFEFFLKISRFFDSYDLSRRVKIFLKVTVMSNTL